MNENPTTEPALPVITSHPSLDRVAILRRKQVEALTGHRRSTIYNRIQNGLLTKPVNLGGRTVGWPASEIAQLNTARISGWSDEQIRKLVRHLEAARRNLGGAVSELAITNQPAAPAQPPAATQQRRRREHHGHDRRLQHDDGGAA